MAALMHWSVPARPTPEEVVSEARRRDDNGDHVGCARLLALHDRTLADHMRGEEKRVIEEILRFVRGNRTNAAYALGISREGLHKKIRAHGIEPLRRRTA